MKQWFYYSVLRACKLYTYDYYQTATKNVLPFIRNSELCMCYKILFWPAIFQRFFPSSALGPVLRASHIAQEPTGWFPRPSFLAPWKNRAQSAWPSLEVRAKRARLVSLAGYRVEWRQMARSFLLLSWARVPTDSLSKINLKYFRRFVDSHPGFSQWFDTFMSSFETEHFVNSQSISLTKSFK